MAPSHASVTSHDRAALGFERLVFFSDAVFAIAITLLVLDLRLPPPVHGALDIGPVIPKLIGFVISFFVIGIYWLSHHRLFDTLRDQDSPLRVVNLVFLAAIVFLPFPTSVVSEMAGSAGPVVFYALSVSAVGLMLVVLALTARRSSLMRPGETRGGTARWVIRSLAAPLVFLATTLVAPSNPTLAMLLWIGVAPAVPLFDRVGIMAQRRIDGAGRQGPTPLPPKRSAARTGAKRPAK